MEYNEITTVALLVFFILVSIVLRILLHKAWKREDAAVKIGHKLIESLPVRDQKYDPNRAYRSISEWGSDRGISFYRRETPSEVNVYIGAKGWNIDQCKELGMMITIPTYGKDMTRKEEQADVDDNIISMVLDMLLRDFGRSMQVCNKAPDESLLYSSKKEPK